jgi:hypothetical protein
MNRSEKLRLSADAEYCHCFKHGMFARFFEQGLHWFSFIVNGGVASNSLRKQL